MEKLKVIELFAGIGSQTQALKNIKWEHEVVAISEFDKYAVLSYEALHGKANNLGDITKIHILPQADLWTYSFPCELAGNQILTEEGYKNVEDIRVGDRVLTHKNRYKKVSKVAERMCDHHYIVKAVGVSGLKLTGNHPLWVLRDGVQQFIPVSQLKTKDMVGFNINKKATENAYSDEYLWLLGRYVADGHYNKYHNNSINFAIGFDKYEEFITKAPKYLIAKHKKYKKSCWDVRIADAQLKETCLRFGNGAENKEIPEWVIDLPKDQLQHFFDGYMSGDGHIRMRKNTQQIMFSTVSERLCLSLQRILIKLKGKVCSVSVRVDKRKPTFNNTYNAQLDLTQTQREQIKAKDKIFTAIRSITKVQGEVQVFRFQVDTDYSYTTQNIIAHNCQDISNAGKQAGIKQGTRSGLLFEVQRLLENVKNLISKNHKGDFEKWLEFLSELGYTNYWQVLNAKDYGIPQSRERVFVISIRGGHQPYEFPPKQPLTLRLKDMLEDEVDEKYYLSETQIQRIKASTFNQHSYDSRVQKEQGICRTLLGRDYKDPTCVAEDTAKIIKTGKIEEGKWGKAIDRRKNVYSEEGVAPTLEAAMGMGGNIEPKIEVVGKIKEGKWEKQNEMHQRVYDPNGVAPTITGNSGGNLEKKIIVDDLYANRDPRLYEDTSPTLRDKVLKVAALRGRPNEHGEHEQQLEIQPDDNTNALTTVQKDNLIIAIKDATKKGYLDAQDGDSVDLQFANQNTRRGRVGKQIAHTLDTNASGQGVVTETVTIRKLTPRECLRLMGQKDSDIDKMMKNTYSHTKLIWENKRWKSVKLTDAIEEYRPHDLEDYVSCTINEHTSTEILPRMLLLKELLKAKPEKVQNVSFVIEKLEKVAQGQCVIDTIKCGKTTATLYTPITTQENHTTINVSLSTGGQDTNTEKYTKITTESSCEELVSYTTSILIRKIIELKTFIDMKPHQSISGRMQLYEDYSSQESSLKIYNLLKVDTKKLLSKSALYKQAGNSIVVQVLEALFTQLKESLKGEE